MSLKVSPYTRADVASMRLIWNEVVRSGTAFPQMLELTQGEAEEFFAAQTACGVAKDESGGVVGLYILHPNNVGRCGHLCNASYAVANGARGRGAGEALVRHCIKTAGLSGFRILQFNAVVKTNLPARALYEKLGFTPLGDIPGGFLMPDGSYETIVPYYLDLTKSDPE